MPSVDERVAYLEGRVEDHYGAMADLPTDTRELRTEMRELRVELRAEVHELRVEMRELRADMNRQFHAMDTKINWVIGGQLALALAVIGALVKR